MEEGKIQDLISKYLAGELTTAEEQDLDTWSEEHPDHKALLDSYQQVWELTDTPDLPFQPNPEKAWENILPHLEEDQPSNVSNESFIRRLPLWSKAAAVALILSIAYFLLQSGNGPEKNWVVHATTDQQQELILPDQTKITLNANSHLRYLKEFLVREVELEGEAYFDVAHNEEKPFTIYTGNTKTTVLGTAFNLRAYPEEEEVELTMERGKVAFTEKANPESTIILQANESGVFSKPEKRLEKAEKVNENAMAWKKHALYFNDAPLNKIVDDLERYFNVDIELSSEALGNCAFKVDFEEPDLDQILMVLEVGMGLKVQRQDDKIVFSGAGCESK